MGSAFPFLFNFKQRRIVMNNEKTEVQAVSREVICEIQKSETEIIRISTSEFKGVPYVDVRIFFKDENSGEYRPTKKGLTVRQELLHALAEGIFQADQAVQEKQ